MRTHWPAREKTLVGVVASWILVLHLCCFLSAGALWRDEANSIQQAQLPTWNMIWDSLRFDSFPLFYPVVLRLWSWLPWGMSDAGLRLLGLATGLCTVGSIWVIGRLLGGRAPLICLILLTADPVFVSEAGSIRPYGISVLGLVWAFGFFARHLIKPSRASLAWLIFASVMAVQASYTNALFVGVLSLCAAGVAANRGARSGVWVFSLPSVAAGVSLLPYIGVLRQAQDWASMLHSRVEWLPFLQVYLRAHSLFYPLVWAGFSLIAFFVFAGTCSDKSVAPPDAHLITKFSVWAALAGLVVQVLFAEAAGIPPFPRYFLPGALLLAFALEALLASMRTPIRGLTVVAALLLTAAPSWTWLRQRHTNMDSVAEVLGQQAGPRDLVVISPWFLHPSFQRYYHGDVEWITVPDLGHHPMMRYDLIKGAILRESAGDGISRRLESVVARGGAVWFVSQRVWTDLDRREAPERPAPASPRLSGADYVRFRSYWEREIEYRLHACCRRSDVLLPPGVRVWDEEDLILTRWSP